MATFLAMVGKPDKSLYTTPCFHMLRYVTPQLAAVPFFPVAPVNPAFDRP